MEVCLVGPRDDVPGRFFDVVRRDEAPFDFWLRPLFADPDDILRGAPFLSASFSLTILPLLKVNDFYLPLRRLLEGFSIKLSL